MLGALLNAVGQTTSDELKTILLIAVNRLDDQFGLAQNSIANNQTCKAVILPYAKSKNLIIDSLYSESVCFLSKEEIFLDNIPRYIIINSSRVGVKRAHLKLSVVSVSTASLPKTKVEVKFIFRKMNGQWTLI